METVFSTPELFESILFQLDMRTLLTSAQRVNHAWHDLIAESPSLQKKLFFKPDYSIRSDTSGVDDERKKAGRRKRTINPLLAELFAPLFPGPWPRTAEDERIESILNEFTQNYQSDDEEEEDEDEEEERNPPLINHREDILNEFPIARKREALVRRGASWRRMLVQQPPSKSLGLLTATSAMGGSSLEHEVIEFSDDDSSTDKYNRGSDIETQLSSSGLRMGLIYDLIHQKSSQERIGRICVLWLKPAPLMLIKSNSEFKERNSKKLFSTALDMSDVVLYDSYTVQCMQYGFSGEEVDPFRCETEVYVPRNRIRKMESLHYDRWQRHSFLQPASS